MIRAAVLCHYPPCWFARCGIDFDPAPVQAELENEAFSSVEGLLLDGMAKCGRIDLQAITFSKAIRKPQTVSLGERARLHVLPARPMTGMPVGWIPRLFEVRRLLADLKPDVVHGIRNLEGYGLFAAFSGFPNVVTPHELLSGVPRPFHMELAFTLARLTEAATFRRTRNIITITEHVRRFVEERSRARTYPVPNIIHPSFYEVRKGAHVEGILFVGRIAPEKGLLDLLRALQMVRNRGRVVPLRVVGGPSGVDGAAYFESCQEFARRELEAGQVKFLGWQPTARIAAIHHETALFAMPSQAPYETMGLVIAEALAAGTPSIVYDFGPLPMLIRCGKNGEVVKAGAVEELAAAIGRILDDPALLKQMSAHAREGMHPFRQETVIESHLDIYETIVAEARSQQAGAASLE